MPLEPLMPMLHDGHLHAMFMQAPASIAVFRGPEHIYEFANPRYLEMLGRTALVGRTVRDALPEIESTGIFTILDNVFRTGTPFVATELFFPVRKWNEAETEACYFSFNLYPLRETSGAIYGQICVAIDITTQVAARRRLESLAEDLLSKQGALQESELRFRQLANAMPQIVWMARPDGFIDYFNDRWYEITGSARDLKGDDSWKPLVHPEDRERNQEAWYAAARTGQPYEIQSRLFDRQTGGYRWYLGRALPVRDATGMIIRWFGTRTDIHDYRMTVEALKQSEAKLARHTVELERSNAELQQFAYVAAHDLQEPIRMIISYLQLFERQVRPHVDEKGRGYFNVAINSANHMQGMIRSVLEYSKIGKGDESRGTVDMDAAVQSALLNLSAIISETGTQVEVESLPSTIGQPSDLVRLFQNLISNGIKFRGVQPPRIRIHAECVDGQTTFAVADNGIGIAAGDADRLFGLFQRLHNREDYPGNGIGLASCKKIVENHGGRIWFESRPGDGTTFKFTLPGVDHDL